MFLEIFIRCPPLKDPPYGSVDQTGNKLGSTAHYDCDKGYKLVGDEYRECLYTGYWNGSEPVCKRKGMQNDDTVYNKNATFFTIFVGAICPYLVDPPYGKVNQRGNIPPSVAYYSCNYGYELYGLRHRQCLYDGTWYGVAPECRPVVKSK